ncbi:MAG: class I SAM-dependent methyltransferase [Lachnospiraceae bacterium]|nr:class I SAM-dependent methyltransferase [Lachnospiraceae bacterium]
MNETIEYYNKNAESFIAGTINADMSDCRNRFLKYVKKGGSILDAGCGSGRDSLAFKDVGYKVAAFDASEEICKSASERLGFKVDCKRFEDLEGENMYDGIWASASLLHVKEADLKDVMSRLKRLLKAGGILYASFKEGNSERIKDGRFFHDMTEEKCKELFKNVGIEIQEIYTSQDVRDDRVGEMWVNVVGKIKNK